MKYTLDNGEEINREYPETFWMPPRDERESLLPGEIVKLIFRISLEESLHVERMWVVVEERNGDSYVGVLDNDPYCTTELRAGASIEFCPEHVIQIYEKLPQA
ncbi:DUF2314 domain-containing protein [Shewanella avicenniae]|uniref:DUF2314 domain-containing protein n=1 Tax=Shewanella avicenniae TaxID=2814294 RepID=A0ABX7QS62_9GAMM|nr:DUF2314 domain-containing protein [Shewanella avicenniae]QSX33765.1 DUF2314 domain-containing protein [Shewanella avicenniae]